MSDKCCGISPRIWRDNKWRCSECETPIPDNEPVEQIDFFGYNPNIFVPKKCDCGAEKLYGPNVPGHYPMCSKLK